MKLSELNVGDVIKSYNYGEFKITYINSSTDIGIEFIETGYKRSISTLALAGKVLVKDLLKPNVYSKGYLGGTEYNGTTHKPAYIAWRGMLKRSYYEKYERYNRYGGRGVHVSDEWHNFQNFCKWFYSSESNYREGFHLDKDILKPNCKVYSKETAVFIPHQLNTTFISNNERRGEYPVGVNFNKAHGKFKAALYGGNKFNHLGYFNTPEQAFAAYKQAKESYIKQVALDYYNKNEIPLNVYEALCKYEVQPYPE